jgi:hypothetical protein
MSFMRFNCLMIMILVTLTTAAQPKKRPPFSPAKFEAELEQFIASDACLTPTESAKFFPIYRQMMKKQRMLFDEMRRFRHVDPKDNAACADAIRRQDEVDIQIKQLQQEYHARFMLVLPACKALAVIKAEEKFHRQMFRKFTP